MEQAPYLTTLIKNPNHIGCHTFGESEEFFAGTHEIERETIELLAVDLFNAQPKSVDGYIASGGTEANIQACWVYRNFFRSRGIKDSEIVIICSEDTHYSIPKAANLLNLDILHLKVDEVSRQIEVAEARKSINLQRKKKKKAVILVLNMGTTMFGSVDSLEMLDLLKSSKMEYKVHVDGAYGGFIYAVSDSNSHLGFDNHEISSITIDAHKMLQAPYGTGIFLCRKNLIHHSLTSEAGYVHGLDITLSGSRSGANAIAVWMILMTYGYHGWRELIQNLLRRTDYLCEKLEGKKIGFYRNPHLNIVTLYSRDIDPHVCKKFGLVPETHTGRNRYWKIVLMQHVDIELINKFLSNI